MGYENYRPLNEKQEEGRFYRSSPSYYVRVEFRDTNSDELVASGSCGTDAGTLEDIKNAAKIAVGGMDLSGFLKAKLEKRYLAEKLKDEFEKEGL